MNQQMVFNFFWLVIMGGICTVGTLYSSTDGRPSVVVNPDRLFITSGEYASFKIRLSAPPLQPVTVEVLRVQGNPDIWVAQNPGRYFTFTLTNWSQWQTVILRAGTQASPENGVAIFSVRSPYVKNATVTVEVSNPNLPPEITIKKPIPSSILLAPADVVVEASATDPDGAVAHVTLYLNERKVRTIENPPYLWTPDKDGQLAQLRPGDYTLRIVAVDDRGASSEKIVSFQTKIGILTSVSHLKVPLGGIQRYQIRLSMPPTEKVIVQTKKVTSDPYMTILEGESLTFTPNNWNQWQSIILQASEEGQLNRTIRWVSKSTNQDFLEGNLMATYDSNVIIYSKPSEVESSELYTLKINGQICPVYRVWVNPTNQYMDKSSPGAMAYFDFVGRVTIEIIPRLDVKSVAIRPFSKGIQGSLQNGRILFELEKPAQLFIEINGQKENPLFIFANPLEKEKIDSKDKNVIYFGPGLHHPGEITIQSGQTLYLAGGAVVRGYVRAKIAENIRILGRGILDGSLYQREEVPGKFVDLQKVRGFEIRDIILLDAFQWNLRLLGCQNGWVENIKIISWRRNTDGIDPVSCENLVIKNCFIKNHDDGISVKGDRKFGDKIANIQVSGCTMWQNWMRSFVLGGELAVSKVEKILFTDSDIIFSGLNPKSAENRDAALSVWNVDSVVAGDVTFRNIRVEESERLIRLAIIKNQFSKDPEWGSINGVTFDNVSNTKGPAWVELSGKDATHLTQNILLRNVQINGKWIRKLTDLPNYKIDPYTKNIRFEVTP